MEDLNNPVRVRFAPSPTGRLHIGGARTALYNYLVAKKFNGQFILRIEDTDQKRLVQGAEKEIIEGLRWMGIDWDEGPDVKGPFAPYRQSERKGYYLEYSKKLVEMGKAYYCFCAQERLEQVRQAQQVAKLPIRYDGKCRDLDPDEAKKRVENGVRHVIRFKSPRNGVTCVRDLIRGEIRIDNKTVDDYILVKSDGYALYHLAAVVDDHLMKISHVIRGSEWLSTLPLHAMIYRALEWQEPEWLHLSLFLKPSGKGKMSKRESQELINSGHSIFITDLQEFGYLPEAVVNWIALMGWSYDDHTEFFSMEDLISKFDIDRINPSPAAIDFSKFDHFNGLHIRALNNHMLADRLKPYYFRHGVAIDQEKLEKIVPIIRERITTLDDAVSMTDFIFRDDIHPNPEDLVAKGLTIAQSIKILEACRELISTTHNLSPSVVETPLRQMVADLGYSAPQVFGILRVSITGQKVSPPLLESMEIIGKERTLKRIDSGLSLLKNYKEKNIE